MPEIKRFGAIPVYGDFDEDGTYHAYDRPQWNLFVEALGSDGMIHSAQCRSGPDPKDYPELEQNTWMLLESALMRQMKGADVWDA